MSEEEKQNIRRIIGDMEAADGFMPSKEQVWFDVLENFIGSLSAYSKGVEDALSLIPDRMMTYVSEEAEGKDLTPLKQSIRDRLLKN